jgi:predicted xylose isomerase-like sugar epimerase
MMDADRALAAMVALCQQIEMGGFADPLGHEATMLADYAWAVRELEALGLWPAPPRVALDIPMRDV